MNFASRIDSNADVVQLLRVLLSGLFAQSLVKTRRRCACTHVHVLRVGRASVSVFHVKGKIYAIYAT